MRHITGLRVMATVSIFNSMKLPNAGSAIVEQGKIVDYLLNPSHPDNGGKAAFFSSVGFTLEAWPALAMAFCGLAKTAEIVKRWKLRTVASILSKVALKPLAESRQWCGLCGLLTVERTAIDWSQLILTRTKTMIAEHERVVLTVDVPSEGLESGDVGTVVHIYKDGQAFEVEFTTLDGKTAAVATLEATQVRPVGKREITHARQLAVK
jgi:hypothetical protein